MAHPPAAGAGAWRSQPLSFGIPAVLIGRFMTGPTIVVDGGAYLH
jgi:sorbitol-specific phosphotransferase system component IIBC